MYNGMGYPFGKKGEDIPIGARIIAVVDAYDALTSWRPYREQWEQHAALAEIKRCVDRGNFDPKVVHTLMELVN
jgi:HD-GYP domain-containing protein (c-di-GMP phosphodiesterase class II)